MAVKTPEKSNILDLFKTGDVGTIFPHVGINLSHLGRTAKTLASNRVGVDLSGKQKLILLIGAGQTGKTTVARWMGENALARAETDGSDPPVMISMDLLRPDLTEFFPPGGVAMPPGSDNPQAWFEHAIDYLEKNGRNALVNFGGDDAVLLNLAREVPELHKSIRMAVVAIYCLTPRVSDLNAIVALEQLGFQPEATALVLNCARVDDPASAFAQLRSHPEYQKVIGRGAIELWLPRHHAAAVLENQRLGFLSGQSSLNYRDQLRNKNWLDTLANEAFAPIRTWLP